MDDRRRQWRNSWQKRTQLLYTFLFLSPMFLCQEQVTASENGYLQELKNEVPNSNKLDSQSNYFPYDSDEYDYKRASAFFPLRGKKLSSDNHLAGHNLFISDHDNMEDKRAQFYPLRGKKVPDDLKRGSYFMPMRGRKAEDWTEDEYDITDENPNKRASSFMPMRGKKRYVTISDYLTKAGTYPNDVSEVINPSGRDSIESEEKRAHSFVPVRGKRSLNDINLSISEDSMNVTKSANHVSKKRSVSFLPMRGRREIAESDSTTPGEIVTSLLEKKKHSFLPMRGRRDDEYNDDLQRFDKKATTFMPMRGRKLYESDLSYDDGNFDETKRRQSFTPMRGRRTQLRDIVHESSSTPERESKLIDDKRGSSFMPMRGRRSILKDIKDHSDYDKKASSFMPMRGKRSVEIGEKESIPLDQANGHKRATFTPMRGRRLLDEDFEVEPWSPYQLYSSLEKKSSSFMPMRGRRYAGEDFTVAPWPAEQFMSLLDKKSSDFVPINDQSYESEAFTVAPWPADQLMPLLDKKSSFMPMRGRSTFMDHVEGKDLDSGETEKRSSSFLPMRGRRFDGEANFYRPYPYLMAGIGSSLMLKPYRKNEVYFHSPSTRKKKLKINWDAVKRAFHAARGKRFSEIKPSKDTHIHEPFLQESNRSSIKESNRETRTKRSIIRPRVAIQPRREYIALKRPMSFFATRGKRFDESVIDKLSKLR